MSQSRFREVVGFGSGFSKMAIVTCTMFRLIGSLFKHVGVILALFYWKRGFNTTVYTCLFFKSDTFIIQLQYYIIVDEIFSVYFCNAHHPIYEMNGTRAPVISRFYFMHFQFFPVFRDFCTYVYFRVDSDLSFFFHKSFINPHSFNFACLQ